MVWDVKIDLDYPDLFRAEGYVKIDSILTECIPQGVVNVVSC